MKKSDIKKAIEKAEVTQDIEILGTKKNGDPKYGKKLDNFQLKIKRDDGVIVSLGVPAKSESQAKEAAYNHLVNTDIPEINRLIPVED